MKRIILLRGLPASGKSTYAKQLVKDNPGVYKRINRDDLREMMDAYHFTRSNEKFIKKTRDWLIVEALKEGRHVIVDDTNLSQKNINRISQLAEDYKKQTGEQVTVEVKEFTIALEEALKRDANRKKPVGSRHIKRMHRTFYGDGKWSETDNAERGPIYKKQDETLTKAIICDLDGTLALLDGRNPFDASRCEEDKLNTPIYNILTTYHGLGIHIILLSGRMDTHIEETKRWLKKHGVPYERLIMRQAKDQRKDAIIKKEIFDREILEEYYIQFVLDDRDQVVNMWRLELGLPCLQVNYGDF